MPRPLPARRLLVGALAPFALVSLAACGSDDASSGEDARPSSEGLAGSTDEPTDVADEPAEEAPGGDPAGGIVEPAAFLETFRAGFSDPATAHLEMTGDNPAYGAVAMEGDADFSAESPEMALTLTGGAAGSAEVRMVDGSLYMQTATQGDKFVELPMDVGGASLGTLAGGQMDPRALVEGIGDSIGPLQGPGEADIDGESVEHYRFTVPGAAMVSQSLGGIEAPELPGMPEEVAFDVYFDEDGRLRRLECDMGDMGAMTMDLTDWGKDVAVEKPSADQLTGIPGVGGPSEDPAG